VEGFAAEPPAVRLALLTAAAKLFFARPPEAQKLLGAALSAGLGDGHQDVHDRALLYYRWAGGRRLAGCAPQEWLERMHCAPCTLYVV
jgi:hypothetical protein